MDHDLSTLPAWEVFNHGGTISTSSLPARPGYEFLSSDCIRLLEILPDDPNENSTAEVSCKIVKYPVHRAVPYTALSYTWGSKPDDCEILLNGHSIFVRKNLWRFLRQAKTFGSSTFKWLWIDALCINQSDHQERTQQVKLMPQIYQYAERVVIWLGPTYGGSEEAMDGLARHAASRRAKKNALNMTGKAVSTSIGILCRRAYWTRLWIFQEVILAQKITLMCGDRMAPWEPFREVLLNIFNYKRSDNVQVSRFEASIQFQVIRDSPATSIVSRTEQQSNDMSLFGLMDTVQNLGCQEPRDRVYALLGVASKGCKNISPDYDTPIPTLLNTILRNHHCEVERPRDLKMVEDQCRKLDAIFTQEGHQDSVFQLRREQGCLPPRSEDMSKHPIGQQGSLVTLWWASHYGHTMVEDLLMNDPTVEAPTWLARAVKEGNEAAVKLLLAKGVDVDADKENFGDDAFLAASSKGYTGIVKLLLCERSELRILGGQIGIDTALSVALDRGHAEILELLLTKGANSDTLRSQTDINDTSVGASAKGHVELVKLLLDRGADVNARGDSRHHTALIAASYKGYVEVVRLLLDRGADVNALGDFTAIPHSSLRHMKVTLRL